MRKIIIIAIACIIASSGASLLIIKSKRHNSSNTDRYETNKSKSSNNQGESNSTPISADDILNKIKKTNTESFSNYSPAPIKPIDITIDPDHPESSIPNETKEAKDKRLAWWRDSKVGIMIHWGVYSVPAGYYDKIPIKGPSETIMYEANIPIEKYKMFAKSFNPTKFNANNIVKKIKELGFKYLIVTTKHHDGFAMFETKANNWNIVDSTPYKKDVIKQFCEACKDENMPLGFYYSHNLDWVNGGGLRKTRAWDPLQKTNMDEYTEKTVVPQLTELFKNYGNNPKIMYWDFPTNPDENPAVKIKELLQKNNITAIQNNRLQWRVARLWDFTTLEYPMAYPPSTPESDTEIEVKLNRESWGYKVWGRNMIKPSEAINIIADVASKGMNITFNIDLDSLGEIPKDDMAVLEKIGAWLKTNGEAIYGSHASPLDLVHGSLSTKKVNYRKISVYKPEWDWRLTSKPNHYYLILLKYPEDGKIIIPDLPEKIKSAKILYYGQKVGITQTEEGVEITELPKESPDPIATVVDMYY
jgi:alpha-L-fucosidase